MEKAIIIGGGPAGLSTALRLHQTTNISCAIYELRPEPTTLGGAIGIFSNGMRLLHRLGLHDDLLARGSSHSCFVLRSMQGGVLGEQDMASTARKTTGFGYLRIKRTDLLDVLLEAIAKARIPVHYGKRLTAIEDHADGVTVTFSDGTTDTGDVLLGCDGIHSYVRKLYVDPDQNPVYSGFAGIGSIIPIAALGSSAATASNVRGITATLTQEGAFGAMSCSAADDELLWGFSKEVPVPESGDTRDGWEVQNKAEVARFKESMLTLLEGARGDWGDTMRKIVQATDVVKSYPIFKLPLGGAWSRGRCLLLGDAAHAMPPHAGQGVSMALEDAFLAVRLLKDLKDHPQGQPLDAVFATYDRIRRPRVDEIAKKAASNADVRKKTGPVGLYIKEWVIWAYMWVAWAFGLQSIGVDQRHLVYDIDEAKL
ncbi:salicylate hydroxylase [Purpureocillium lavendulum]|uniref:Salicylate hydroxylase n=1 Tax=Purpureocillium lavendulum TaxID=1247861 RepID=A0AB34FFZ2_9HYPO|nr:salicylate hydroxylase [Purpureocillium lavendulum]